MYVSLVCHTEPDFINSKGFSFCLKSSSQTFLHFDSLFEVLKIPVTFSLGTGGRIGDRVLKEIKKRKLDREIGLHVHYERFNKKRNRWEAPKKPNLKKEEFEYSVLAWKNIIGTPPKSCVFGHWLIDDYYFDFLSEYNIKIDSTYTHYKQRFHRKSKYILKPPFFHKSVLEVPNACGPGHYSLNPFEYAFHRKIISKLIKKYNHTNMLVNIGFHSYDLFEFRPLPTLKPEVKQFIKFLRDSEVNFVTLSEIGKIYNKISKRELNKVNINLFDILSHKLRIFLSLSNKFLKRITNI